MIVFIPISIFDNLNDCDKENYSKFITSHIYARLLRILKPQNLVLPNLLNVRDYFNSLQLEIYSDYVRCTFSEINFQDVEVHISKDLWGILWHSGQYPTLTRGVSVNKKIFCLPLTLELGSFDYNLNASILHQTENPYIDPKVDNKQSSRSIFIGNKLSQYRLSISDQISYHGRRFSNEDYRQAKQLKETSLICITGGSAAYSTATSDLLTFPSVLEFLLSQNEPNKINKVLNFGDPGSTVSSNIQTIIDEVLPLKPGVIINYGGYNEVASLLIHNNYIKDSFNVPHHNSNNMRKNLGQTSIKSHYAENHIMKLNCDDILRRLAHQYVLINAICQQAGCRYIQIIQPISYFFPSKMSNFEKQIFHHYAHDYVERTKYEKIKYCLSRLHNVLISSNIESYDMNTELLADINRSKLTRLQSFFHDTMHTTFNFEFNIANYLHSIIKNAPKNDISDLNKEKKLLGYPF